MAEIHTVWKERDQYPYLLNSSIILNRPETHQNIFFRSPNTSKLYWTYNQQNSPYGL